MAVVGGVGVAKALLVWLVAVALAGSEAEAVRIPGASTAVTVIGKVWCSADGSTCKECHPLDGARVFLLYNGKRIKDAIVANDASFTLYVNNVQGAVGGIVDDDNFKVRVLLPANDCEFLKTGVLVGTPHLESVANGGSAGQYIVHVFEHFP